MSSTIINKLKEMIYYAYTIYRDIKKPTQR